MKQQNVDIDTAVVQFIRKHWQHGFVSVTKTHNGHIKVLVEGSDWDGLPMTFKGYPVSLHQDCGPAGEKLLVRDQRRVIGVQG